MGQQQDQGKNQQIPWKKWKYGHNSPKSGGDWESNPKREIHSIIGLSQKQKTKKKTQEKAQMNNLTLHLEEKNLNWTRTGKEQQTTPKLSRIKEK